MDGWMDGSADRQRRFTRKISTPEREIGKGLLQNVELHLTPDEGVLLVDQCEPLLHQLLLALSSRSSVALLHQPAKFPLQNRRLLVDLGLLRLERFQFVGNVVARVPTAHRIAGSRTVRSLRCIKMQIELKILI